MSLQFTNARGFSTQTDLIKDNGPANLPTILAWYSGPFKDGTCVAHIYASYFMHSYPAVYLPEVLYGSEEECRKDLLKAFDGF